MNAAEKLYAVNVFVVSTDDSAAPCTTNPSYESAMSRTKRTEHGAVRTCSTKTAWTRRTAIVARTIVVYVERYCRMLPNHDGARDTT